jgi:fructoselysine-6-P-deglycase FrlB-like protein
MTLRLDENLLARNKEAEICSLYVAPEDISRNLSENADQYKQVAQWMADYKPDQIILAGSGASYCSMYTGYYYMKTCSRFPVRHYFGPELKNEDNTAITSDRPLAIVASYSGKTADTLETCSFLKRKNIPRVAISKAADSPLSLNCDKAIAYNSKCLYTSAMASVLMLLAEFNELVGETQAASEMKTAMATLPDQMASVLDKSDRFAREAVKSHVDMNMCYCLGDGATWALAYQYGYTHIMEYVKENAGCLRSSEWRHGPLEVLYKKPSILMFIGNDGTRQYAMETKEYCEQNGAKLVVFDSKDYFDTHPALSPFALHAVDQLFLLYLTTVKGLDSDEGYLQMHRKPYKSGETYF